MALKQDERALLQLVCERGQSYADLAELLGISEGAVREKARAALAELGGSDPDADVGLTDYLLGQADPIGRADAVRYLQSEPEALQLAETIETKLAAIAPGATLPKLPEPKGRRRRADAPVPTRTPPPAPATDRGEPGQRARSGPAISARTPAQSRLIAGLVAGGVILVFAILAIAGVFGDEDDAASDEQAAAEAQREVTDVRLRARGGSGVAGNAAFGLANDSLFIDLNVQGLDPDIGDDSVYVLWLMLTEDGGYPVSIVAPGQNGSVQDRYPVPTPVAVAVAGNARFVQISESPARGLRRQIDQAVQAGAPLVPFSGDVLSRGRIPLAEGVEVPEGAEGAEAAPEAGAEAGSGAEGAGTGSDGG